MSTLISIVVPTHNERENIRVFYDRLAAVFGAMVDLDFELIFCDDSSDDTPEQVKRLCHCDRRVKLIRLSRRFSQAIAITAGLNRSQGSAVVIMDADLQDPPETIPSMVELWKEGYEIVYAQRQSTSDSWLYRTFARAFYRILHKVAAVEIPLDAGEFRLLDRSVIRFLSGLTEHTRFLRGLTVWPGLRQAKIEIARQPRSSGRTNYNFTRSLLVAVDGLVSFSIVPLRVAAVLGGLVASGSLLVGLGYLISRIFYPQAFGAGWTSLMVSIAFLSGIQLMCLGVIGEYIGRIFIEVQNRPVYWIDYEVGFEHSGDRSTQAALGR